MPAWKFYEKEHQRFKQNTLYHIPVINRERINIFVKAICEKYSLPIPEITHRGREFHKCFWKQDRINFIRGGSVKLGIICHEMAHYIRHKLHGCHRHNDALMNLISELLDFLNQYVMNEGDRLGRKTHSSKESMNNE